MHDVESVWAKANRIAFLQPSIRGYVSCSKSVSTRLSLDALQEEPVPLVGAFDRDGVCSPILIAQHRCKFGRTPRMVEMPVCQQNTLHIDVGLLDCSHDPVHLASRIDHQRMLRFVVPEQSAVLLEGCDRDYGTSEIGHATTFLRPEE
jgi:hypothetical protein